MEAPAERGSDAPGTGYAIEAVDIVKRYGQVEALSGATLRVRPGEVLALVGDNGAGKSTLAKVICGAVAPDGGHLAFWGRPVAVSSIRQAQELGVETVYQDLALAPDLSVAENLFLGREPLRAGAWAGPLRRLDRAGMREAAQAAVDGVGLRVPSLDAPVRLLSGGQRQGVAVARAVMWARSAILMDEPTAALGPKQTGIVYDAIVAAAARGLAVVVISHDIPRMLLLAHRIAVLRQGRTVGGGRAADLSLPDVVTMMLGGARRAA